VGKQPHLFGGGFGEDVPSFAALGRLEGETIEGEVTIISPIDGSTASYDLKVHMILMNFY
jgi:hypothetical protein